MRHDDSRPEDDDDAEVVDALPVSPEEPARRASAPRATGHGPVTVQDLPSDAMRGPAGVPAPFVRTGGVVPARTVPVAQAAAVAATGFAAGAVTAAVVRGLTKRHAVKAAGRRGGRGGLPVVGSRSFLVDVHLLGPRD